MNVSSIFIPISPPNASISLTKCPFAVPPILGLQGIIAIESKLIVHINVFNPNLAHAKAASHPACPAPTITISNSPALYFIITYSYFPQQKSLNILFTKSSSNSDPVISPNAFRDAVTYIEIKSKNSFVLTFS